MTLRVVHPIYYSGEAISHICSSLCDHMRGAGIDVSLFVPACETHARRSFIRAAVPTSIKSFAYRIAGAKRITDYTAERFIRMIRPDDAAYIWPGSPLWMYERLRDKKTPLVMERINCHRATARRILDDAYARLKMTPSHGITDEDMACETRKLELTDFVFSPSPNVSRSLEEAGVPSRKILGASYGWDDSRIRDAAPLSPKVDGLNAIFVGRICVRKGAPLLLEAWARAGVKGRLLLAGRLDDDVAEYCAEHLKRDDIVHLPYTADVAGVYASADCFVFPTLEEGSPLVVYEAMASGLPVVTSLMGGGEIVRNGREGWIMDAWETDAWVERLRAMADDVQAVRTMGLACRERAEQFTWRKVAQRRRRLLLDAIEGLGAPAVKSPALVAGAA